MFLNQNKYLNPIKLAPVLPLHECGYAKIVPFDNMIWSFRIFLYSFVQLCWKCRPGCMCLMQNLKQEGPRIFATSHLLCVLVVHCSITCHGITTNKNLWGLKLFISFCVCLSELRLSPKGRRNEYFSNPWNSTL